MDMSVITEYIYKYILVPATIFIWWIFKKYDKRLDEVENRLKDVEKETAVLDAKLDGLKEGIDDIKDQLHRLFDMLKK